MLADQRQLLARLGQLTKDVLDEVVRGDGGQVPLQFAQHHQLPLLRKGVGEEKNIKPKGGPGVLPGTGVGVGGDPDRF